MIAQLGKSVAAIHWCESATRWPSQPEHSRRRNWPSADDWPRNLEQLPPIRSSYGFSCGFLRGTLGVLQWAMLKWAGALRRRRRCRSTATG